MARRAASGRPEGVPGEAHLEAGQRFDLSPAEEEFLFGNWKES